MKQKKMLIISSKKGSSTVIYAIAFTVIIAIAALAVDIGVIFLEKSRLSSTVDAAALAGAQEFISQTGNVRSIVDSYIQKNKGTLDQVDVLVDSSLKTVEVRGYELVDSYFSRLFGYNKFKISASAAAKIENIKSLKGVRPLAVIHQDFTYGKLYTLKEGAGDGSSGNDAAIALGSSGGSTYKNNLLNGYDGTVSADTSIETETGNMSGTTEYCINQLIRQCTHTPQCTYEYYNKNCSKIIYIPIVDSLEINGRKYVKVLGFATFFLEGVTSSNGHADVIGRFITYSANGETSSDVNDYGTYGIRLVK